MGFLSVHFQGFWEWVQWIQAVSFFFFFLSDFSRGRERLELRWDGLYYCSRFSLYPVSRIIHLHSLQSLPLTIVSLTLGLTVWLALANRMGVDVRWAETWKVGCTIWLVLLSCCQHPEEISLYANAVPEWGHVEWTESRLWLNTELPQLPYRCMIQKSASTDYSYQP